MIVLDNILSNSHDLILSSIDVFERLLPYYFNILNILDILLKRSMIMRVNLVEEQILILGEGCICPSLINNLGEYSLHWREWKVIWKFRAIREFLFHDFCFTFLLARSKAALLGFFRFLIRGASFMFDFIQGLLSFLFKCHTLRVLNIASSTNQYSIRIHLSYSRGLIERWFRHSKKIRIFSSRVAFFLVEVHSWSRLFNPWAFILQRLSILGSLILLFSDSVYHVRQPLVNPYSLVIGLWLKEKLLRLIPYFFQNIFWKFIL